MYSDVHVYVCICGCSLVCHIIASTIIPHIMGPHHGPPPEIVENLYILLNMCIDINISIYD